MSGKPFCDAEVDFYVLVKGEKQHSLRPTLDDVPDGWRMVEPKRIRTTCLGYMGKNASILGPIASANGWHTAASD